MDLRKLIDIVESAESIFSPDLVHDHTHDLPRAIRDLTGARLVQVVYRDGRRGPILNQLSDDAFLDANGVRSKLEIQGSLGTASRHGFEIEPIIDPPVFRRRRPTDRANENDIADRAIARAQEIVKAYNIGYKYSDVF